MNGCTACACVNLGNSSIHHLAPAHAVSDFRLVAVLERVQGGLIGQTLSKFGIVGLYTVVVYSIGALQEL